MLSAKQSARPNVFMSLLTMRRRVLIVTFGVAAVAAAYALWWQQRSAYAIDPADRPLVARGRTVYAQACASCHGADLEGQPNWQERRSDGKLPAPPHDATGHTWHHTDDILFKITREGVGAFAPKGYATDMPAFMGVLSDDEIRASLAFIKSRWPASIRSRQAEMTQAAQGR